GALERASPTRLRQEDLDSGDGGGDRRAVRRPDQSPDESGAAERASNDAAVGSADDRPRQQEPPVEPHSARCRPSQLTQSTPRVRLTRSGWSDVKRRRVKHGQYTDTKTKKGLAVSANPLIFWLPGGGALDCRQTVVWNSDSRSGLEPVFGCG